MRKLSLLILLFLTASLLSPLLLVYGVTFASLGGVFWDWANGVGYAAVMAVLVLFVYSGRPQRSSQLEGRFFALFHQHLGQLAVLLVTVHIAALLWQEPLLLEHLKPSAPLYMLAGLCATILLIILTISALPTVRRQLWSRYPHFRQVHWWLAVLTGGLIYWHILGSAFYAGHVWQQLILILAGMSVLLWQQFPWVKPPSSNGSKVPNSRKIAAPAVYASGLLCGLIVLGAVLWFHRLLNYSQP